MIRQCIALWAFARMKLPAWAVQAEQPPCALPLVPHLLALLGWQHLIKAAVTTELAFHDG